MTTGRHRDVVVQFPSCPAELDVYHDRPAARAREVQPGDIGTASRERNRPVPMQLPNSGSDR